MPDPAPRPALVVLDVNETLSDTAPLADVFVALGLGEHEVPAWFAGVLRDGFALSVVGENPAFADLAAAGLRARLPRGTRPADADAAVERLLAAFSDLPVHPDVVPGLTALADAGVRLVTLSNGSASVAERVLGRAGVADRVERLLGVADAPAWKPDPRAYAHALAATGVPAGDAMLVAVHPWDVDGAARAGLRTAWVDRSGGPWPAPFTAPELTVSSLTDLAGRLGG